MSMLRLKSCHGLAETPEAEPAAGPAHGEKGLATIGGRKGKRRYIGSVDTFDRTCAGVF